MACPVGKLGSRLAMFERGADEDKKKVEERKQIKIPTSTGGGVLAAAQKIKDVINIPPAQAAQAVWDKFLEGCTESCFGVPLKEARLIYIGRCRGDDSHDKLASKIIDRYGKDGDIFLYQGYNMGKKVKKPEGIKFTKQISTYGCGSVSSRFHEEDLQIVKEAIKYGNFGGAPVDVGDRFRKVFDISHDIVAMESTVKKHLKELEPGQKIFVIGSPAVVQSVPLVEDVATHIFIPKGHKKWTTDECIAELEKETKKNSVM